MMFALAGGDDDVIELREALVHSSCPNGPTYRGLHIPENGPLRQYTGLLA
jgi:hypothetical protein